MKESYLNGMCFVGIMGDLTFFFILCGYKMNSYKEDRYDKLFFWVLVIWSALWLPPPLIYLWCKGVMG